MPPDPLKPFYRNAPIRDLDTLAEVLELSRSQLERMARSADRSYRCSPQKKKDGSERITWDAHHQLKAAQHLIKERILAQVSYPLYLQGVFAIATIPGTMRGMRVFTPAALA